MAAAWTMAVWTYVLDGDEDADEHLRDLEARDPHGAEPLGHALDRHQVEVPVHHCRHGPNTAVRVMGAATPSHLVDQSCRSPDQKLITALNLQDLGLLLTRVHGVVHGGEDQATVAEDAGVVACNRYR